MTTIGDRLLYQTLYEGIAEFVTTTALNEASTTPAVAFGKLHTDSVRSEFIEDMWLYDYSDWLWNNHRKDIVMGDLAYCVGYEIAERYYRKQSDTTAALATLIELDYNDSAAVYRLVDESAYLSRPLAAYRAKYEAARPRVIDIQLKHTAEDWSVGDTTFVTLTFFEPMDTLRRGFDLGPLGADQVLPITRVVGWSVNGRRFDVAVVPPGGGRRQVMVSPKFRSLEGYPVLPYLIEHTITED